MNAARIVFFALTVVAILGLYLLMGAEVIATRQVVTLASAILMLFGIVTAISVIRSRKHE
jgi:NADH:ubiquinone oxidoreductase subunit 6 (subunit J)